MAGITMDKMMGRDKGSDDAAKDVEARRSGAKAAEIEGQNKPATTFPERITAKDEFKAGVKADAQVDEDKDKPVKAASNKPAKGSDYPVKPGPHAPGSENHPAPGVPKNSVRYDKEKPSTFT